MTINFFVSACILDFSTIIRNSPLNNSVFYPARGVNPGIFVYFCSRFSIEAKNMVNTYSKWVGHLAVFTAYLIFGFNIIICKDLTSSTHLSPGGIFLLRSIGAGCIFWILSLFMPKEHVPIKDMLGIFCASALGFFITQLTFLMAIPIVTPLESSLVSAMSPVCTMLIAAVAIHEPLTLKKILGVAVSLLGMVYLILTGISGEGGHAVSLWGITLMVVNVMSFSAYLGMFRPLINRYSVVTFMKWIFFFSFLLALPVGFASVVGASWGQIPVKWFGELSYLIVCATFMAYFLIPFGQKIIRPTLVSMYSYVQPIVAIGISIAIGMDTLTVQKVVATVMVFGGVYIVSRSRAAHHAVKA